MHQRVAVIVNASSGTGAGDDLRGEIERHLAEAGINAKVIVAAPGDDIDSLATEAAANNDVIVAGGGDGTVSAVAVAVHKAGKTLGVLPLGTLNNFSKDLGIPQDIAPALEVLKNGVTQTIDLAEANGRIFINNSSIGLYPRIVRKREKQQRLGYGKWRAALWAALRIFSRGRFVKVKITLDDQTFFRKTPFVFVGNNRYEMDLYNIGRRVALDDGKISVYFLHRSGRWGVIMLIWHTLTGRVKQWRDFEEVLTESVTIQTRRRRIAVAFDGEVATLETPLEYKIIPEALKVIVPQEDPEDA
jgi:YegS/Rv2252/BmrU family lipid kinase